MLTDELTGPPRSVVYSSTYGHIRTVAEAEAAGAKAAGAEVTIFQFPEILSDEVLAKMHAAPKADYRAYCFVYSQLPQSFWSSMRPGFARGIAIVNHSAFPFNQPSSSQTISPNSMASYLEFLHAMVEQ